MADCGCWRITGCAIPEYPRLEYSQDHGGSVNLEPLGDFNAPDYRQRRKKDLLQGYMSVALLIRSRVVLIDQVRKQLGLVYLAGQHQRLLVAEADTLQQLDGTPVVR